MLTLEWTCDECGEVAKFKVIGLGEPWHYSNTNPLGCVPVNWKFAGRLLLCPKHTIAICPFFVPDDPTVSQ